MLLLPVESSDVSQPEGRFEALGLEVLSGTPSANPLTLEDEEDGGEDEVDGPGPARICCTPGESKY